LATKKLYNENFYDALKHLETCEISRVTYRTLHKNPNGKVIPFVRLFELKMADQLPSDYVQPVSSYSPKTGFISSCLRRLLPCKFNLINAQFTIAYRYEKNGQEKHIYLLQFFHQLNIT
jgi:hypothetical protein